MPPKTRPAFTTDPPSPEEMLAFTMWHYETERDYPDFMTKPPVMSNPPTRDERLHYIFYLMKRGMPQGDAQQLERATFDEVTSDMKTKKLVYDTI